MATRIKRVDSEFDETLQKLKNHIARQSGLQLSDVDASKIVAKIINEKVFINSDDLIINKKRIPKSRKVKLEFDFKL